MTNETIKKYTRRIAEANKTEIIAIVYEILEIYLDDAIMAHKEGDMELFDSSLKKASKCFNDLIDALDLQYEISKNLMSIYMFMNKEISIASVKRDAVTVSRIQAMVTKLKISFEELAKQDESNAVMGNAQGVYAGLTYGKGTLNESIDIQSNRGFKI